jgi:hypothetical protein
VTPKPDQKISADYLRSAQPRLSDLTNTPAHDKNMARDFLASLDPNASKFTFQFFGDRVTASAEIFHGTLDEVWPKVQALNTPTRRCGAFVTINETDFKGRSKENIVRPRALFVDADNDEQVKRCIKMFYACGAAPSRTVKSGRGLHFYFCTDVPRDQFTALQKALANKVGTDPAVHDLPRVMRLPGTLHLKDPTNPRLVKLSRSKKSPRWKFSELVATLGLSSTASALKPYAGATPAKQSNVILLDPALFPKRPIPPEGIESLAEGIEREEMPPLDPRPILMGCGFFREAFRTGGSNYAQPLWNLTTLGATFMEKGEQLAHDFGNKHPTYTPDNTKAMYERKMRERQQKGLGWPSCNAIQTEGCKLCATCKHFGKIKSPLNLALPMTRPKKEMVVHAKESRIDPVSALLTLREQDADIGTLLSTMNKTYAVVRYGNDILVANIVGNDVSCMNEQNFHKMLANLEFFDPKTIFGNLREMKERIERIGSNLISMPIADFHKIFSDLVVIIDRPLKVSRRWFNWDGRRRYLGRGVVFEPGGPLEIPNDMLNLWRGFGIEPKQGDWSLLRNHILNVVCSGQQDHYDYMVKWMAYAVQHPNEPIGVAVAFRGAQGAGKGIVARTFGKLFGKHFAHIANGDQLTGRFNASLGTSCVVFLDEALWAADKKGEGVLKALITEPTLQLEAKFRDPIMVDNRLRIIVASNNDWVVPTGIGDRRWFVLDVANTYAGTEHRKYWVALYAEIENGGAAAMFHDLLAMDLSGFDVRAVPHTAAKAQQQAHSLAGTEAWLYDVLQEGAISYKNWECIGLTVSTDDAYGCYEDFSKRQHAWRPQIKSDWSKKMRTALGRCVVDRKQKTGSKRVRMFQLAPLSDCRRQFATHVGAPNIEWESENEPKSDPTVANIQQAAGDISGQTELDEALDAPEFDCEPTNQLAETECEPKIGLEKEPSQVNSPFSELLQTGIVEAAADLALVRRKT